jgi:hypothetical protein
MRWDGSSRRPDPETHEASYGKIFIPDFQKQGKNIALRLAAGKYCHTRSERSDLELAGQGINDANQLP